MPFNAVGVNPAAAVRDAIFAEIPREQVELALVAYQHRLDSPWHFCCAATRT